MYARTLALVAPISSNTAPRSSVNREMAMAEKTRVVVRRKWRRVEGRRGPGDGWEEELGEEGEGGTDKEEDEKK